MIRNIYTILMNVPAALIALSVHEFAHGYVSSKLGDPTPKADGRLTLNPLAHLDPVGALLMILTGFGWASPVQINPSYYRHRTRGIVLTAFAGPFSNLVLAFVGMLIGVISGLVLARLGVSQNIVSNVFTFTSVFTRLNLSFMVFNLLPFPPLDGFKIFGPIMTKPVYYAILRYEYYIMYLLMFLSIIGVFSAIIGSGVSFFYNMILNSVLNILGLFI